MNNPYTCDNCLFNPIQYREIGTKVGFCLKYSCLLRNSLHTTCHFLKRKDLPSFLAEEGVTEHASEFPESEGIVFYYGKYKDEIKRYCGYHAWATGTYDPYLYEAALYHKTAKKWTFIQAFAASRNPIKSIMSSSLTRRYIGQCGPERDNYLLILSVVKDLKERIDLRADDFRWEVSSGEFSRLEEFYLKDIKLFQLYAIQEYGHLMKDERIMWISDELNGSLLASWKEFFSSVDNLVPAIMTYVIESAQKRNEFFPKKEETEIEEDFECAEAETEILIS
jgi:hypothetical protein